MKTPRLVVAFLAVSALVPSFSSFAGVQPVLEVPLERVLQLPKTRAVVYTPARLRTGDSVSLTTLQLANGVVRGGSRQGIQITVFVADPSTNEFSVAFKSYLIPVSTETSEPVRASTGGGMGAGKVQMNDFHFSEIPEQYRYADGSVRVLVTVLGIETTDPQSVPRPAVLPKELSLTVQADQGGTALLLPAVQKVREAAAR